MNRRCGMDGSKHVYPLMTRIVRVLLLVAVGALCVGVAYWIFVPEADMSGYELLGAVLLMLDIDFLIPFLFKAVLVVLVVLPLIVWIWKISLKEAAVAIIRPVLVLANVAFCAVRLFDALVAVRGGMPLFSIFPLILFEPSSRPAMRLVLWIMPVLSLGLPLSVCAWGMRMRSLRRRGGCEGEDRGLPVILLFVGSVLLVVNVVTMYVIRRSVPLFYAL